LERAVRRIAWTSAVIHGLVHASVLLLPTMLADLQRAFQVSLLDVLAIANLMYLVFGLAAVPAGYFADRVGSRTMLFVSASGCALSLLVVATAGNFAVLSTGLVALGFSAGVYHPSGLSLLSRRVASGERGRAIGIHGVGGSFGEALAPAFAGLVAGTLGWRWGFGAAALMAGGSALLTVTLPADPVHATPRVPGPHGSFVDSFRHLGRSLASFWRSRPLRWLLLSTVVSGFVYRGVLTFLPLHLGESVGGQLGSSLTSLVLVAGIVAQRFGGELADRLPRERLFLAEVTLFVPVLVLLGLTSGVGLVALALCFGFLWYLAQPLASAMAAAYAETDDHGLLYGVQFASTFGIGSFATIVGGLLVRTGGTSLAFVGFGVVAILQFAAALALFAGSRRRADVRAATSAPSLGG
jgi:MFS family permease